MASWRQKRDAIKEVVRWALQLPAGEPALGGGTTTDGAVQWEGERGANRWTNGVWCNLRLSWVVTRGRDETRQMFDEDNNFLGYRYGGQRHFVVMVMVGSDDQQDMDAIGSATQSLRVLIRHPYAESLLDAVDVGLGDVRRTIHADYTEDGVRVSQSMTEITFNTWEEFVETAENAVQPVPGEFPFNSYITRVQTEPDGEGRFVTGHDGTDIIREIDVNAED